MTTTTSSPPEPGTQEGPLTTTDEKAFAFLGQVNTCLRACLCTLARHGVALRRREPERAGALLARVECWPLYKGGQFLFDLMEWEDLMLDGDPPPLMPAEHIRASCTLPVQWIAAATTPAPGPAQLIPGQRIAAALDLPLRMLTTATRAALTGAAQDLTDLLATPFTRPAGDHRSDAHGEPGPVTDEEALPALEAGFYLYRDIVLGALTTLGPLLAEHAPEPGPPPPSGPR